VWDGAARAPAEQRLSARRSEPEQAREIIAHGGYRDLLRPVYPPVYRIGWLRQEVNCDRRPASAGPHSKWAVGKALQWKCACCSDG
jgi:hypothetical protein